MESSDRRFLFHIFFQAIAWTRFCSGFTDSDTGIHPLHPELDRLDLGTSVRFDLDCTDAIGHRTSCGLDDRISASRLRATAMGGSIRDRTSPGNFSSTGSRLRGRFSAHGATGDLLGQRERLLAIRDLAVQEARTDAPERLADIRPIEPQFDQLGPADGHSAPPVFRPPTKDATTDRDIGQGIERLRRLLGQICENGVDRTPPPRTSQRLERAVCIAPEADDARARSVRVFDVVVRRAGARARSRPRKPRDASAERTNRAPRSPSTSAAGASPDPCPTRAPAPTPRAHANRKAVAGYAPPESPDGLPRKPTAAHAESAPR